MIVEFLEPTDYKPTPTDSPRCFGQLRLRPTNAQVPQLDEAGEFKMPPPGPMVSYFRKGATPELPDELAMGFIAAGVAKRIELDIRQVSKEKILAMTGPE